MDSSTKVQRAVQTLQKLRSSLERVIRGRTDTIKLVLTGLVADGHVLLEDYPGSGKTTLAKTLGRSIDCSLVNTAERGIVPFRRVQFTPDLLPSDVLGVNVFEPKSATFRFQHGPIFAHVVLADEINRTGPKVQAAFLEAMAERQVTIDNVTYPLDELFFVIGTQNPLDLAGTYPLPLVQLDRFLLRVPMTYVDRETELSILESIDEISANAQQVPFAATRQEVLQARSALREVQVSKQILESIVDIVQGTRENSLLQFGVSTRAAIMFRQALAGWALNEGRDYVTEDDVKFMAPFVLMHRMKFHPGAGDAHEAFSELIKPHVERLVSRGYQAAS